MKCSKKKTSRLQLKSIFFIIHKTVTCKHQIYRLNFVYWLCDFTIDSSNICHHFSLLLWFHWILCVPNVLRKLTTNLRYAVKLKPDVLSFLRFRSNILAKIYVNIICHFRTFYLFQFHSIVYY